MKPQIAVTFALLVLVLFAARLSGESIAANGLDLQHIPRMPLHSQPAVEDVALIGHVAGMVRAVALHGNYAYVGDGERLIIFDVSDPATPSLLGETDPLPEAVRNIAVVGDYAYVANDWEGLRIIDISDPTAPTEIGAYDDIGEAEAVVVEDNYAYVAANWRGLQIIDASEPHDPTLAGSYATPGLAKGLAVVTNTAYIADDGQGLRLLDVSATDTVTEVGFYEGDRHLRVWGIADAVLACTCYAGFYLASLDKDQLASILGHDPKRLSSADRGAKWRIKYSLPANAN